MNLYPALSSTMGSWNYYTVKMTMRALAENVKFAAEIYDDRTLDEAIQRVVNEKRVKEEITTYLKRREDRFFASIVVAALGGHPIFYPVSITDEPEFALFKDDKSLNETFGVLKFDGTQHYYALDGQHRLAAIRSLILDGDSDVPKGFENEEVSVIVIVPRQEDSDAEFMRKYRRLFSSLNRYAKPTDPVTNIIMDEDDTFAILTRRLITDHEFFRSEGRQLESRRIKTTKGKNMNQSDPYFTTLETLYEMNIFLLSSRTRGGPYPNKTVWGPQSESYKEFKRFRPDEDYVDELYIELNMYWDALIKEIPELEKNPHDMRVHSLTTDDGDEREVSDSLLFWPIGQQLLAEITRDLLDARLGDPEVPTPKDVEVALSGLGALEWRLHEPPWQYFLLTQDPITEKWRMRSEDRAEAVRIGKRIQEWVLGIDPLDDDGVATLKVEWQSRLVPFKSDAEQDEMWEQVKGKKSEIAALA